MQDRTDTLPSRPAVLLPGLVVADLRKYLDNSRACDRDGELTLLRELRGYLGHALAHYEEHR